MSRLAALCGCLAGLQALLQDLGAGLVLCFNVGHFGRVQLLCTMRTTRSLLQRPVDRLRIEVRDLPLTAAADGAVPLTDLGIRGELPLLHLLGRLGDLGHPGGIGFHVLRPPARQRLMRALVGYRSHTGRGAG